VTVRLLGHCRRCGRACPRGTTRCWKHPLGRPRDRDDYAEAWEQNQWRQT